MIKVEKNVPEADCVDWLEKLVKAGAGIRPKEAYKAGAKKGFSRDNIKAARRYFGILIETRINGSETLWFWRSVR